jgi:hypothetical protein
MILGVGISAFTAAYWRLLRKAPLASALLVAASAFGLAYLIQWKGWLYQAIPLVGCASMALASLLAETAGPGRLLRLVSPSLLALPLFFAADERVHRAEPTTELLDSIAGLQPGDSVAFLAVDNALPWSVTLQHGFRYPSRYMAFWMMKAIVQNEQLGKPDARLEQLGHRVVSEAVQDWRCIPPKAIIVERPGPRQHGFDILKFFERDSNFVELLGHYRARPWAGFQRFDQISALPRPEGPCRTGV